MAGISLGEEFDVVVEVVGELFEHLAEVRAAEGV